MILFLYIFEFMKCASKNNQEEDNFNEIEEFYTDLLINGHGEKINCTIRRDIETHRDIMNRVGTKRNEKSFEKSKTARKLEQDLKNQSRSEDSFKKQKLRPKIREEKISAKKKKITPANTPKKSCLITNFLHLMTFDFFKTNQDTTKYEDIEMIVQTKKIHKLALKKCSHEFHRREEKFNKTSYSEDTPDENQRSFNNQRTARRNKSFVLEKVSNFVLKFNNTAILKLTKIDQQNCTIQQKWDKCVILDLEIVYDLIYNSEILDQAESGITEEFKSQTEQETENNNLTRDTFENHTAGGIISTDDSEITEVEIYGSPKNNEMNHLQETSPNFSDELTQRKKLKESGLKAITVNINEISKVLKQILSSSPVVTFHFHQSKFSRYKNNSNALNHFERKVASLAGSVIAAKNVFRISIIGVTYDFFHRRFNNDSNKEKHPRLESKLHKIEKSERTNIVRDFHSLMMFSPNTYFFQYVKGLTIEFAEKVFQSGVTLPLADKKLNHKTSNNKKLHTEKSHEKNKSAKEIEKREESSTSQKLNEYAEEIKTLSTKNEAKSAQNQNLLHQRDETPAPIHRGTANQNQKTDFSLKIVQGPNQKKETFAQIRTQNEKTFKNHLNKATRIGKDKKRKFQDNNSKKEFNFKMYIAYAQAISEKYQHLADEVYFVYDLQSPNDVPKLLENAFPKTSADNLYESLSEDSDEEQTMVDIHKSRTFSQKRKESRTKITLRDISTQTQLNEKTDNSHRKSTEIPYKPPTNFLLHVLSPTHLSNGRNLIVSILNDENSSTENALKCSVVVYCEENRKERVSNCEKDESENFSEKIFQSNTENISSKYEQKEHKKKPTKEEKGEFNGKNERKSSNFSDVESTGNCLQTSEKRNQKNKNIASSPVESEKVAQFCPLLKFFFSQDNHRLLLKDCTFTVFIDNLRISTENYLGDLLLLDNMLIVQNCVVENFGEDEQTEKSEEENQISTIPKITFINCTFNGTLNFGTKFVKIHESIELQKNNEENSTNSIGNVSATRPINLLTDQSMRKPSDVATKYKNLTVTSFSNLQIFQTPTNLIVPGVIRCRVDSTGHLELRKLVELDEKGQEVAFWDVYASENVEVLRGSDNFTHSSEDKNEQTSDFIPEFEDFTDSEDYIDTENPIDPEIFTHSGMFDDQPEQILNNPSALRSTDEIEVCGVE